jgi:hypothetical protein
MVTSESLRRGQEKMPSVLGRHRCYCTSTYALSKLQPLLGGICEIVVTVGYMRGHNSALICLCGAMNLNRSAPHRTDCQESTHKESLCYTV